MAHLKRQLVAYLLIFTLLLALAGCSTGQTASLARSGALAAPQPASGAQAMLSYLKTARADLDLIDEILADKDIGLLDDSSASEDITQEKLTEYEGILTKYSGRIHDTLTDIDTRTTPDNPDVAKFKTAEKTAFQTIDSILNEYNQALSYAGVILEVSTDISGLGDTKQSDLQAIYDSYSTKLNDCIKKLQAANAPSFLESTNKDFIDALQQMDAAVLYALNAIALNDPVRSDSAEYRMGILSRHFDAISKRWEKDFSDREAKLRKDSQDVQTTTKGLRNWLDTNITALGG